MDSLENLKLAHILQFEISKFVKEQFGHTLNKGYVFRKNLLSMNG